MAVLVARQFVADGRRWVVDMDLEKFFDRVNQDILMLRVARRVKDKEVLRLIRRYLQAGMMEDGVVSSRHEGIPQGGSLSPLLSNILLDELDKESVQRLKSSLIKCFHRGRGRNLKQFNREDLNPKLRGWFNYFSLAEVKNLFEELDRWVSRHLRNILWRQLKRPRFRVKKLIKRGLSRDRARQGDYNGHGPWFNSGASHMNLAFRRGFFNGMGLYSLLEEMLLRKAT